MKYIVYVAMLDVKLEKWVVLSLKGNAGLVQDCKTKNNPCAILFEFAMHPQF